ncbi:MAG: phosphotransferase [Candidatus Thiodiazotropha taylori]|uniref:Phosphotransferase n=1 Tax=Candidatus Thiodiazotropha taylori TaxID=2792791 RepID=A0A9E4N4R7_9GAMM|nr:phosphotransferase [Candidatus Thiodiazotropha taylori]MCW4256346.1 phosphotransferase [Candidatus Thiodiazotropha taylori]
MNQSKSFGNHSINPHKFLGCFSIPENDVLKINKLRGGIENNVYRINTLSGEFVLRIYRNRNLQEVQYECNILSYLDGGDYIRTPKVILTRKDLPVAIQDSVCATLYTFIDGEIAQFGTTELLDDTCRFVEWFQYVTNKRKWNCHIKSFRVNRILSMCHLITHSDDIQIPPELRSQILSEIKLFPRYQELFRQFPDCLVHGDLMPSNLILDSNGRLSAVIDFDDSYVESALFEYTSIARGMCFTSDLKLNWHLLNRLYNHTKRVLGAISQDAFFLALRYVCFRYFVYIYYSVHIWGLSEDKPLWLKDFRKWRILTEKNLSEQLTNI